MMTLKAFSVHDSKANAFITPFFCPTTDVGIRSFQSAANDPNSMFSQHPADYTLFEIGSFDVETGTLTPHKAAENLGLALHHQNKKE